MREREFIEWICSQTHLDGAAVPVGPGDDCAVIMFGGEKLLVTTDQALDGVHFVLTEHGPHAAGRKAMARSLSDVAAMVAVPVAAVATVAMPNGFSRQNAKAFYRGLREASDAFSCPVVGGDVASWPAPLAVSVTIFARPAGVEPVLRSGAQVGDAICVTGQLGGAWKTLRHMSFTPRITEAIILAGNCKLHAMIDISDGPAADLKHLCVASGVAAEINAADVPVHPDAAGLEAALGDGEDYELLFTLSQPDSVNLLKQQPLTTPISRIGTIVEGDELTLIRADGTREQLKARGWEHET